MEKATIVVDLGFGDAGKGTIVDYLARMKAPVAVVRFNGGGQAAHNVHTEAGLHHTFAQFGSASMIPGVNTYLSRFMLVDPMAMGMEERNLSALGISNIYARTSVDARAKVVSLFHKAANRLRESARGVDRHGSCGMGIGEVMGDSFERPDLTIYAEDLRDRRLLLRKLTGVQEYKREQLHEQREMLRSDGAASRDISILEDPDIVMYVAERMAAESKFLITDERYLGRLAREGDLIFEGAQGVLLDENYGFHPYTTWSTTTFKNAHTLLDEIGYEGDVEKLGVLRAYYTRHGAGPFPTEDRDLTRRLPDPTNVDGRWQGPFRVGWFDTVLARYAIRVCGGIDTLAITNLDRWATVPEKMICVGYGLANERISDLPKGEGKQRALQVRLTSIASEAEPLYERVGECEHEYLELIQEKLSAPISLLSRGPTASHKTNCSLDAARYAA